MKPKPPCYDTTAKRDCPDRSATCHATCGFWQAYESEKEEFYAEKESKDEIDWIMNEMITRRITRIQRRMQRKK